MRVYLWFYGEHHARVLREQGPGLFLRTTTNLCRGTTWRESVAKLHESALRSFMRERGFVWVGE